MITKETAASMIDISDLRTDTTVADIETLIGVAKKYDFVCVFALPCYAQTLVDTFRDVKTHVGATVGYPSGAEATQIKIAQTQYLLDVGCDEFDMVLNVGWLKSKKYKEVGDDIMAVRKMLPGNPLKVIIESMYLEDNEIVEASKIVRDCGADYIKSGSGWASEPTTLRHIEVMKQTLGDSIKIKAAGGVRDLDTLLTMYDMGVTRFGLGIKSGIAIMDEIDERTK